MNNRPKNLAVSHPSASERRRLVKELAGAVSTQAKFSNRAWIALMTVAVFAVLPHAPQAAGNIALPFNLGDVNALWFHGVVFSILVVLTLAFASAHAQQVRAQKLAQSVIDSIGAHFTNDDDLHARDWFDILRVPSLNRLAPLAQSLRGKYQFLTAKESCPAWLRWSTASYYGLLKLASMVVYFALPGWALWRAFRLVSLSGGLQIVLEIGGLLAGVALFQVFMSDLRYALKILCYLWRSPM